MSDCCIAENSKSRQQQSSKMSIDILVIGLNIINLSLYYYRLHSSDTVSSSDVSEDIDDAILEYDESPGVI